MARCGNDGSSIEPIQPIVAFELLVRPRGEPPEAIGLSSGTYATRSPTATPVQTRRVCTLNNQIIHQFALWAPFGARTTCENVVLLLHEPIRDAGVPCARWEPPLDCGRVVHSRYHTGSGRQHVAPDRLPALATHALNPARRLDAGPGR
jgi:hypothetical protein